MWAAQLLSCYWCFKNWRYTQFEGLPPRMSASLGKLRQAGGGGGGSSSGLLFTAPGPGLGGASGGLVGGYQSISTAHSI